MAKTLNLDKLLTAAMLVSKVPRDVFVEQVSKHLGDQSVMGSWSNKELSQALEKLNLEATTKDFLASFFSEETDSKQQPQKPDDAPKQEQQTSPQQQETLDLGAKIDALKTAIDSLNGNIERIIKQEKQ